jgi:hypothetical protein
MPTVSTARRPRTASPSTPCAPWTPPVAVGASSRETPTPASGSNTLQLPDLSGTGLTGLALGDWSIDVQTHWILAPGLTIHDFNLVDLERFELSFAQTAAVTHAVQ